MAADPAEFPQQADHESTRIAEIASEEPGGSVAPGLESPPTVRVADQRSSAAQWIIAVVALLAGLYFGKLVLVVILVSVLLAFVLAPLVDLLARMRVPNWAGALISVLLFCTALYGLANVSYNKAVSFMEQLPRYRGEIQSLTWKLRQKEQLFEKNANQVLPTPKTPGAKMVQVQQQPDWTSALTNSLGTATELALAASFVPFLAYFMLSWQEHVRSATIMLFSREERSTAYATLGAIVKMVRAFIVGNLIVGLLISGASTAAFGFLHLPYFYFLGVISGFLSLIPYLGPLLAVDSPVSIRTRRGPRHRIHRHSADGFRTAHLCHECALPKVFRQPPAVESAGRDVGSAFLGMALGSHGPGAGDPDDRRHQDHLRSRTALPCCWIVARRIAGPKLGWPISPVFGEVG